MKHSWLRVLGLVAAVVGTAAGGHFWRQRSDYMKRAAAKKTLSEIASAIDAIELSTNRRGELLYLTHCSKCHGPEGHGDGEAAVKLQPPPRDFARRPWRFEPTAESIRRVTSDGIPGTSMPAAKQTFSPTDLDAVTAYVLSLAGNGSLTTDEPRAQRLTRVAGFLSVKQPTLAPNFTVVDVAGKSISLADYRGKVVVIYFWGTGCPHCLQALPAAVRMTEHFRDAGLELLPICADSDDGAETHDLATQAVPGIRTFVDESGNLVLRYEVQALPHICVIDREGRQIAVGIGAKDWESPALREWLAELIKTK